jgi:Na+-driven multidrug efflux pump
MMIQGISLVSHAFLCYFLAIHMGMGIAGAGLSFTIVQFSNLMQVIFYAMRDEEAKKAMFWPDKRTF